MSVEQHPSLALYRAFNEALTRAANSPCPKDSVERGALVTLYVLADCAGMRGDQRVAKLWSFINPDAQGAPQTGDCA